MTTIRKSSYGNYTSSNYGVHCMRIDVGNLVLWFSYNTVVAFQDARKYRSGDQYHVRVCENLWGPTTGKHLNMIDGGDKKNRLPREEFEKQLTAVLVAHKLILEN